MNMKIAVCFIVIIYFLPAASASTEDNVWAARTAGFIGLNDTLRFENYIIKAEPVDDEKAAVTVYRNHIKLRQMRLNVSDFYEYGNIRITLLGIYDGYSWISISKPEIKDILKPYGSKLLRWGEKYEIDGYTIIPEAFTSGSVNLMISNRTTTETVVLSNNSFSDQGNLRIVVTNINQTGFVMLEFLKYPLSNISAGIYTDKNEYAPDEVVQVSVNITGGAVQNTAGVFFKSSADVEFEPPMLSLTDVTDRSIFRSNVTHLPENSTVTLTATVEVRDYNNNRYTTRVSKTIHTLPVISITKRVPRETDEQNVTVELYIHNAGTSEETVHVYDAVYVNEKHDLKPLTWVIKLKPGGSANISYQAVPQKIGRYIFPPAVAKWKIYSSASKEVETLVHGPNIVITKSAVKKDAFTDVRLDIRNSGDRPALVNVSDKIPDGYTIRSGNATWEGILEGGESAVITYSLSGNVSALPAAMATYRDIHGVSRQTQSNTVEITEPEDAVGREKNNTSVKHVASGLNAKPAEMLAFMVLSFIVIAGIMAGGAATACLSIRLRKS